MRHLDAANKAHSRELAEYSWTEPTRLLRKWTCNNDLRRFLSYLAAFIRMISHRPNLFSKGALMADEIDT
jgi:hypothetical protein